MSSRSAATPGLARLAACVDYSWLKQLLPDPATARHAPNKQSRQVSAGHYVEVLPDPLPAPALVVHSPAMAAELGLEESDIVGSDAFARAFSGDIGAVPGFRSWATPYALSIFGQRMYRNCPFGNGNGYGDGRAMSIAEVLVVPAVAGGDTAGAAEPAKKRWELQLKGAGQTPFCRGADGRAVLRSSVREFLVSEAMHALGVSTTRALSLVLSGGERVNRPWYKNAAGGDCGAAAPQLPTLDDPRLARYPPEVREALIEQLRQQLRDPDVMRSEPCAITCRAAPSFLRVGHLELHARRAGAYAGEDTEPEGGGASAAERREALELIVRHALFREFEDVDEPAAPLERRVLLMLREARRRLAQLTADWVRVGFVQGNFNSDNCLVGGRTMDYGPFGFIELYDPKWNMWSGGGEHFSFMNQPVAAQKNFETLVSAVMPLLAGADAEEARDIAAGFSAVAQAALAEVWRRKLGLAAWDGGAAELYAALERLMRAGCLGTPGGVDWTLLWRQLAAAADVAVPPQQGMASIPDAAELLALLEPAFYAGKVPEGEAGERWRAWLSRWAARLAEEAAGSAAKPGDAAAIMRGASPKYVPREWMLVEAYTAAYAGDFAPLRQLRALFERPFDEQPEHEAAFYRRRPDAVAERGGTAFMS